VKRIALLVAMLATVAVAQSRAQVSSPSITVVQSAPSGACAINLPDRQVATTGALYSCQNGTWAQIGSGGGGGSGTVTSVGCTAPLVCSPAPITTSGTAAAPSLVALGTIPTCASIATAVLNGTITQGICYTSFTSTQINSLTVEGANTITIGAEPPSGNVTYLTSAFVTYDSVGPPFVCSALPLNAFFSLGYTDQSGDVGPFYQNAILCIGFLDQTNYTTPVTQFFELPAPQILTAPLVVDCSSIAGEAITLANSGDVQTTGGTGSHVKVVIGFQVSPCP
jgi:hypothetical protein